MNIIGIGGLPRSGKDALAELLMVNGYYGVSLGDIVRDESRKRHSSEPDPISVKNMTETSNFLRSTKGADFALKEALKRYKTAKKAKEYKGLVVFSVRAPVEVDFILEKKGRLVWVEAQDEVRHERSRKHRRAGEVEHNLAEMKAQEILQEKPQPGIPEDVQMDTSYVKAHATDDLENNGNDIATFYKEAKKLLDL